MMDILIRNYQITTIGNNEVYLYTDNKTYRTHNQTYKIKYFKSLNKLTYKYSHKGKNKFSFQLGNLKTRFLVILNIVNRIYQIWSK